MYHRRPIVFALVFSAGCVLVASGGVQTVETSPSIRCESDTICFDAVNQFDRPQRRVQIMNVTDVTVRIEKVRSSCACLNANMSVDELSPGETSHLDLELITDVPWSRERTFTVFIKYEAPKPLRSDVLFIQVQAAPVEAVIKLLPPHARLDLGDIYSGSTAARSVKYMFLRHPDNEFISAAVSEKFLDVILVPPTSSESRWGEVRILVHPDAPIGELSGVVELESDCRQLKHLKIPFSGYVVGNTEILPRLCFIPYAVAADEGAQVLVRSRDGTPFRLKILRNDSKRVLELSGMSGLAQPMHRLNICAQSVRNTEPRKYTLAIEAAYGRGVTETILLPIVVLRPIGVENTEG